MFNYDRVYHLEERQFNLIGDLQELMVIEKQRFLTDEELERYHRVSNELADVDDELSSLYNHM